MGDAGRPKTSELELLSEVASEDVLEQRLHVGPDVACLEGHFPGFPVLPGIAQLHRVMRLGERLLGQPVVPTRIDALKFREVIQPGEEFVARVELAREKSLLRFRIDREGRTAGSGRLVLSPAEEPLGVVAADTTAASSLEGGELVPQSGAMLALGDVLATDEKRTVCAVRAEGLPFFRAEDGSLPGWAGLEPMAQCIAAHGGLYAPPLPDGGTRVGFLLGCRRLQVRAARLDASTAYAVAADRIWGATTGLVSFDCELFEVSSGRRLLAGRINAYLPEDLSAVMEGRLE